MPQVQDSSALSQRTTAFVVAELLKRALPTLLLEKFGQAKTLPAKKTKTMVFRRYNSLSYSPKPLVEGVTPTATSLTWTDITVVLSQYGDITQITDVVEDTHEDPIVQEGTTLLSEQAAAMVETIRYNVLKAGTNVFYANGSQRTDVNTPVTRALQRKVTRALKNQNAKQITRVVSASANFNTSPVAPSFVALCHPNLEGDIRNMIGFVPVENYGSGMTPYESEIGKVEDVRYIASTIFTAWADGGAAKSGSGTEMLSTAGTNADVYPILFLAQNAYGIVALKGKFAVDVSVINPSTISKSDPLGQRGYMGWKTMQGAVILNDAWMARAEVAATA